MKRILDHARRNAIAYLALFISIGGTSYAAITLPANSVGTRQLKNHSITPIKFDRRTVGAYVRAWAVIRGGNQVIAARPRASVVSWDPSFAAGVVSWGSAVSSSCFALASSGRDFVQAAILPGANRSSVVHYQVFNTAGQYDPSAAETVIAVVCPQP